jgi:hypothetical protein
MKKLILLGILSAFLFPFTMFGQSNFDGTWKIDLTSAQFPKKPDVFLLQNGTYDCKSCVPPISVKADGQDHPVTGHPYYDTVSVKVIDNNTIEETDKRAGKTVAVTKLTVSADGKTLHFDFTDSSNTNADPVKGQGISTRVEAGPAGSHAISGSWRITTIQNLSSNAVTFTLKVDGDTLNMTNPTGQSYAAKLDGTDAPYSGDPGITTVSVKRIDKNTIEETDKRDGKPITVARMTVSPDGKTMTFVVHDLLQGTTSRFSATKS